MAELDVNRYLETMLILMAHDDDCFISCFRFPRAILLQLYAERDMAKSHALPIRFQVLTTVGSLASGPFQRGPADQSGLCQASLRRVMPAMWDTVMCMSARCIELPYCVADQASVKAQFAARIISLT